MLTERERERERERQRTRKERENEADRDSETNTETIHKATSEAYLLCELGCIGLSETHVQSAEEVFLGRTADLGHVTLRVVHACTVSVV